MEAEVFVKVGAWKNYEELEVSLSLPELLQTLDEARRQNHNLYRVIAGTAGADLGDYGEAAKEAKSVEDIYNEAMEEVSGVSAEVRELTDIGITFDEQL